MSTVTLSPDQQKACDMVMAFLINPVETEMVIEGHSGTGKTFLTQYIINEANKQSKLMKLIGCGGEVAVRYTATTNKAAVVLSEATGYPATTIHSLLGLRVMNNFSNGSTSLKASGKGEKPEGMLIIVDEASMVNQELLDTVREETAATCKVLYIGDPYQLPPVGEDTCPVFHQVRLKATLTTVQRNPGPIAELGAKFREAVSTGVFPNIKETLCGSIMTVDGPAFQAMVNTEFAGRTRDDYARILAWTNGTVHEYNEYVRSLHTSSMQFEIGETVVTNKPILEKRSTAYSTDSTALVTKVGSMVVEKGIPGYWVELDRNVEVFQPQDQWRVKAITKKLSRAKQWTEFFATQEFFADLRSIHSSTGHKCQGATLDIAFIDLNDIGQCRETSLVARILYVVSTRPRKKLVFYGTLPAKYGG